MKQRHYFGGRVSFASLPLANDPASLPPEVLKRLCLPQGELAQIHNGGPGIQYLACIQLVAGTTRGNHFHRRKDEHLYVLAGQMELELEDVETHQREQLVCAAGDLVRITPGIAHVLRIVVGGYGIEFSPQPFDRLDVYRHPLAAG